MLLRTVALGMASVMLACMSVFAQNMSGLQGPASFVGNLGQWDSPVHYLLSMSRMNVWFLDGEVRYELGGLNGRGHVVGWSLQNNCSVTPTAESRDDVFRSWVVGHEEYEGVPGYAGLVYPDLVPGVTAKFQLQGGELKYDLILKPGTDPSSLRMRYEGASSLSVSGNGDLQVATTVGDLVEEHPIAFQEIDGRRIDVPIRFLIDRDEVGFAVGEYDASRPLVIDPAVRIGSYLGGNRFDEGRGVTLDSAGNIYVTGITHSPDFPTTTGAIRRTIDQDNGSRDIFVAKFDPTGRRLIWSTFWGGTGYDDPIGGIRVTRNGTVLIAGVTTSRDLPVTSQLPDDFNRAGSDGFVLALSQRSLPDTVRQLWSTYVGGTDHDTVTSFDLTPAGNILLTGSTLSENFPVPSGGVWSVHNGGSDAFVLELSGDGKTAVAGTFLGGTDDDYGRDIAADRGLFIAVTGWTSSDNFPRSQNAFQTTASGGTDGFAVTLSADFSTLEYGTYIGGSGNDLPRGLALDDAGSLFLTGWTGSGDFPDNINATAAGGWFATKLDPVSGNLVYSRFITSDAADEGYGVAVDQDGAAVLLGGTSSLLFPIPNGTRVGPTGNKDLAFVRLSVNGGTITHGSVVGGSEDESGAPHIWFSSDSLLYLTGRTRSANLPTERFAYDTMLNVQAGVTEPDAFVLAWAFDRRANLVGPSLRILDTLDCEVFTRDTFYLYNHGDAPLTILANRFEIENVDFFFELEEPDLLPQPVITIMPGDSIRYIVRFETRNVGFVRNSLLVFTSDSARGKNPFPVMFSAVRDAPAVLPAPSLLSFGNVPLCKDSTLVLTLNNNGNGTITIEQPEFFPSDAPFRLEPGVSFPLSIPERGDPVQIRVTFSPEDVSVRNDELLLRVRECPQTVQRILLKGHGEIVDLAGVPDSINFSDLPVCSSDHDTVITVRNAGTINMVLTDVKILGDAFQLVSPFSLPDTLARDDERTITVRFNASEVGTYSGELVLRAGPCDTTFRIPLSGSRPEAEIPTLSEDTLDFGVLTFCVGEFAQEQLELELSNPSGSTLELGTPTVTQPFGLCNPNFPTEVAANSSRKFLLCYTPLLSDRDTGLLRIPYNLNGCRDTLVVVLYGERERPRITAQYPILNFPALGACEAFHDTTFYLYNFTSLDQKLDSVQLSRGVELLDPSLPHTLAAGDSVEVRLRFAPVTSGTSNESVRVYFSSRCKDSTDIAVTGFADGLVVSADVESLDLAPQLFCEPAVIVRDSLAIRWSGTTSEDVRISEIRINGTDQAFTLINPGTVLGVIIEQDTPFYIPLEFRAEAVGVYHDTLELVIAPCMTTLKIPLNGEVLEPELSVQSVAFGDVEVGDERTVNVIIANDSPLPLTLDTLAFPTEGFSADLSGLEFPVDVPSGGVIVIPVTFKPGEEGDVRDSLVVKFTGDCEYRLAGRLSGKGVRLAENVEFCVSGLYAEPRFVGETVNIFPTANADVELSAPVDLVFYFSFDPQRFEYLGTVGGIQKDFDPVAGLVSVQANGIVDIPADLPGIQLQLLGGKDLFALVSLDSVVLNGGAGLLPEACDSTAIVSITHRCYVEGVSLGKFPNRLERSAPNPAYDVVEVTFQQLEDARTILRVWNAEGREVLRPLDAFLPGGRYSVRFPVDELPDGMYFYGVQAGSWRDVGTMIIRQ